MCTHTHYSRGSRAITPVLRWNYGGITPITVDYGVIAAPLRWNGPTLGLIPEEVMQGPNCMAIGKRKDQFCVTFVDTALDYWQAVPPTDSYGPDKDWVLLVPIPGNPQRERPAVHPFIQPSDVSIQFLNGSGYCPPWQP